MTFYRALFFTLSKMALISGALFFSIDPPPVFSEEKNSVGSHACMDCHEEEYNSFMQYAKKAHSFEAIKKMRRHLTNHELETCYGCHTTGYGKPGGFVDEATTPDMANAGCEVCHGPGSIHIESEEPDDIIGSDRLSTTRCEACHSKERIAAFNFKPLLHGGAH